MFFDSHGTHEMNEYIDKYYPNTIILQNAINYSNFNFLEEKPVWKLPEYVKSLIVDNYNFNPYEITEENQDETMSEEIKKMIDGAALFKFNKFHFHLSDDQGFRVELESYPQITQVGSVRYGSHFGKSHNDDEIYSGYYTKTELREIVDFCRERHIDVIPEFDVPGHTSAVLSAMPELSCTGEQIKPQTTAGVFQDVLYPPNPWS
jgi:hypothetical protein